MADPKIRYDIEAGIKGEADVAQLASTVRTLGDTLEGDLKKQANDAADALEKLGTKREAIQSFTTLLRTTQQVGQELDTAAAKVNQLGAEMPRAATATTAFASAETRASAAVAEVQATLKDQREALKSLGAQFDSSGRKTEEYKEASAQLKVTISSLSKDLAARKNDLTAAAQATAAAGKAERALTSDYTAATAAAARISAQLGTQRVALEAARAGMQALGIQTGNLTQTQRALDKELGAVREKANSLLPAYNDVVAAASRAGAAQVNSAKQAGVAVDGLKQQVKSADSTVGGLSDAFKRLGPILAASFTGREFVNTIVQAEALKRGLTAIMGSSTAAAAEIEYLRRTSNDLGLEFESTSKAYLSLTAATKGTAIEGEKTRQVFEAVSRAMSALGKSGSETERALTAVSQMASKGTVSMEELRGQLGEALPGALAAAAAGAGITTAQLIQMVSTGDVLAKDLLPALSKGLNDLYAQGGPPEGTIANWNRLKNVISETLTAVGEGGAGQGMTKALGAIGVAATAVGEAVGNVGADLGEFAGAVTSGNFELFTQAQRLAESETRLNRVREAAGFTTASTKEMGAVASIGGDSVREAFRKSEIAAQNAGATIVASALQQKQSFLELEQAAGKRLEQSKKATEAADAEAKTIQMIASAFGNETDKLSAATLASTLQRDAQIALTAARRQDLVLAEQKLAALAKEIAATEKFSPELDNQRKALEAAINVKREEVRASDALAKSHEVAATSARVAAEAYKDNSARVGELKSAYDAATIAVEALRSKQAQGLATGEQVAAAVLKQAAAQKLYTDALADAIVKAEVNERAIARAATGRAAEADLNLEAARTTLELAKARDDDAGAANAQVEVTNREIEAKRQAAQASRDEAAAMRETATAREREAVATGTLSTAKKEEIAALRATADLKDIDAKKSDMLAQRQAALASATQSSTESIVNALEKRVSAQERLNAVNERADALERKRIGIDKDGFATGKDGQRITAGGDLTTLTGIAAFLKSAGVDNDEAARKIARQFADSRGNVRTDASPAQLMYGGQGSTISQALLRAAESYTFGTGAGAPGGPAAASIPSGANTTHTLKLDVQGRQTEIGLASAADAQKLVDALSALKGRST